ncbi:unnamed protein product [Rotaria sp. Silwood1]|nr:unnamed protein product [Rotaria sp. Silwood1]CAF1308450.1 unnamed protein product [Rotaria sp. Silwood1]CAF1319322.1 unnamed protein product [Rotaria sp. Silwood1]CAF3574053.1 unnamed protein product [Rotaria sp. Silwood1]CAF3592556.1 unnamed protein product [Rotaria sp. Silwood1]
MKKLILHLLLATLTIVALCAAQDDRIKIDKRRAIPIATRTVPPIVIGSKTFCLRFPFSPRCHPCKYSQPIRKAICGQGQSRCELLGGTCKFNQYERAYCCPYEHRGCCPLVIYFPIITGRPPICRSPQCRTDAQCKNYEKCCGICRQCVNATLA